jgi:signal transduction histidine kinase
VVLPAGGRALEVDYTGISFTAPEHVRFRYRLMGYDDDWVEAGTRRTAYYTRVPPGRYTFRVTAAARTGVWADPAATLGVRVRPWLWQTWWFRTGAVLVLAAAVSLAVRARLARLHEARARQEAFARQLIESQEAERKRIAGELHDGLGQDLLVVKNRVVLARRHGTLPDATLAELAQIEEAATAALQGVRALSRGLRPYQLDRLGLAQAIEGVVKQAADSAGVDLDLAVDAIDGRVAKDDEIHVLRVVQEAVTNALKHGAPRRLDVRVAAADGAVRAVVRDDGRGFTVERDRAGRPVGGFGLAGIAERVRLLGGTFDVRSAPGAGAEVTITIPAAGAS